MCNRLRTQANSGDSRTVLGVKGRAKPLSFDHKPQNEGMFPFCVAVSS
jgi:serine/threonine protein phosphatase PrpC